MIYYINIFIFYQVFFIFFIIQLFQQYLSFIFQKFTLIFFKFNISKLLKVCNDFNFNLTLCIFQHIKFILFNIKVYYK